MGVGFQIGKMQNMRCQSVRDPAHWGTKRPLLCHRADPSLGSERGGRGKAERKRRRGSDRSTRVGLVESRLVLMQREPLEGGSRGLASSLDFF